MFIEVRNVYKQSNQMYIQLTMYVTVSFNFLFSVLQVSLIFFYILKFKDMGRGVFHTPFAQQPASDHHHINIKLNTLTGAAFPTYAWSHVIHFILEVPDRFFHIIYMYLFVTIRMQVFSSKWHLYAKWRKSRLSSQIFLQSIKTVKWG